jgi:hypothetical protein
MGDDVTGMGQITRPTQITRPVPGALLVAVIASAFLISLSSANSQVRGAVQYPPASVGEDAQPPPPARMAPQSMSPRRTELGVSGPSGLPGYSIRDVRPRASPTSPPTMGGN